MSIVIIGAGQAGFQTAAALRTEGYQETITLIGEEPHLPYQRPPLSKGMLLGRQEARHAMLRPAAFYEKQRIDLIAGERVAALDTAGPAVVLGARKIPYRTLVLATGARNRLLPVDGAALEGVCYLRSLEESAEISERLRSAERVVVIGGGFIGLEVAAAARARGKNVTVIEVQGRLMARAVSPDVSECFRLRHQAEGVRILLNSAVREIRGAGGKVEEVLLTGGERLAAELVVVGIGIVPNTELAREAGLPVGNGIASDDQLRVAEGIFAIGDCAEFPSTFAQARVRLESVQNAVDQGTCVARAICGREAPYGAAPWFWTDQFDIHLQTAGISSGYDQTVVRGDPQTQRFSVFYYRQRRLIAVDSINRAAEHMAARKLIAGRVNVPPERAGDPDYELLG